MNLRLAVVTIWAKDVRATSDFYLNVLNLRLFGSLSDEVVHLRVHDSILTIMRGSPQKIDGAHIERFPVLAFSVADLSASVAVLKENEVNLPWGIESNSSADWVMFHDPAGNLIELVQFTKSGQSRMLPLC